MSDDLLAGAPAPITLADQVICVERELKYRYRVYPHLVATHKMTSGAAEREIHVMTEVLVTLKRLHAEATIGRTPTEADYAEPDET